MNFPPKITPTTTTHSTSAMTTCLIVRELSFSVVARFSRALLVTPTQPVALGLPPPPAAAAAFFFFFLGAGAASTSSSPPTCVLTYWPVRRSYPQPTQMACPGLRSPLQAGQRYSCDSSTPATKSEAAAPARGELVGFSGGAATATGVRAAARAAGAWAGMLITAPHLHLAFLPANSGFHGYCFPQDSHAKVAPPAMVTSEFWNAIRGCGVGYYQSPANAESSTEHRVPRPCRTYLLCFQRQIEIRLPHLIGRPGLAILIDQAAVAPGHEQLGRIPLYLLPQRIVILVNEAHHENEMPLLCQ